MNVKLVQRTKFGTNGNLLSEIEMQEHVGTCSQSIRTIPKFNKIIAKPRVVILTNKKFMYILASFQNYFQKKKKEECDSYNAIVKILIDIWQMIKIFVQSPLRSIKCT